MPAQQAVLVTYTSPVSDIVLSHCRDTGTLAHSAPQRVSIYAYRAHILELYSYVQKVRKNIGNLSSGERTTQARSTKNCRNLAVICREIEPFFVVTPCHYRKPPQLIFSFLVLRLPAVSLVLNSEERAPCNLTGTAIPNHRLLIECTTGKYNPEEQNRLTPLFQKPTHHGSEKNT